jgi:single-strand DNA-binding protein
MAGEIITTIVGNLTADPELNFQASGKAVANFTVVHSNRVKKGDRWEDGDPTFIRCAAWEGMAENVVESLKKGNRVIVQGGMYTRAWDDRDGNKRSSLELRVEAIGPDLRYATAQVERVAKSQGGTGGFAQAAPAADPWATPQDSNPPF